MGNTKVEGNFCPKQGAFTCKGPRGKGMVVNMKRRNPLTQFLIGLVMLVAGGYWFLSSVTVTTGFFGGMSLLGMRISGGLVVVPFIAGIIWLFTNTESIGAKILTGLGLVIIIASVIMSTTFIFERRNLYEYLLMLILIFGGAALSMQVLLARPKDKTTQERDRRAASNDYDDLERQLEELKKDL